MRIAASLAAVLPALLAGASLSAAVPTPRSHFGHEIGADRTVLDWEKVVSYFQELQKNSPRINRANPRSPTNVVGRSVGHSACFTESASVRVRRPELSMTVTCGATHVAFGNLTCAARIAATYPGSS